MNLLRAIEQGVDSFRQYFSSHQKPPMFPFQVVIVFKVGLIHSMGVDENPVLPVLPEKLPQNY
jgi:hypothetical protein